jgi:hypothetical protein
MTEAAPIGIDARVHRGGVLAEAHGGAPHA